MFGESVAGESGLGMAEPLSARKVPLSLLWTARRGVWSPLMGSA